MTTKGHIPSCWKYLTSLNTAALSNFSAGEVEQKMNSQTPQMDLQKYCQMLVMTRTLSY